jgi:hypothetical protein
MRKYLLFFIVLLFIQPAIFAQDLGDVNHDGSITIIDGLLVAQDYVNLNPPNYDSSLADVDGNNDINIIDALLIAQYYVGLITQFPGDTGCPGSGQFTYTLEMASSPTQDQQEAYALITAAMDEAVSYYNCYTDITMHVTVYYDPGVPTAQANWYGPISFGGRDYMNYITAMHEMAHCVGIGTTSEWRSRIVNGIFTGANATQVLREITGDPSAELHGDSQHFWPYGLNYVSEVTGEEDLINHCKIIVAIRLDLGF